MRLSEMEHTFTLHLYLQGNEGPVFSETFYFVSKHPAGDNLQVHRTVCCVFMIVLCTCSG
jgi:hypothetical protein